LNQVNKHAVVFAYHDVGVYCLQALLDAGMHIDLVITHDDDPNENY
jgi:methionyl-tRNA formyltransferase